MDWQKKVFLFKIGAVIHAALGLFSALAKNQFELIDGTLIVIGIVLWNVGEDIKEKNNDSD